jgi:CelD/BcsL family acetyltransferase involved in cellulose biosynthesis
VGFRAFARTITLAGLANGEVELIRISCGGELTGYLLNFLYRGRAMNYQSAFIDPLNSKSKPGLMCHTAAVERYAGQDDLHIYSLLAGKDRYKQSLSTSSEELEWWRLERFSLTQEAEALARRILRR